MKKNQILFYSTLLTIIITGFCCIRNSCAEKDYSSLKIIPPPNGGIYLGQYQWREGDIDTFEKAIGRKIALFSPRPLMELNPKTEWPLFFSANEAKRTWQEGKVVLVHAIEAYPHPQAGGFTVDKLLQGEYDELLHSLAGQFREFGKPMFFNTAREPNGVLEDYFGGFGPNGDKSTQWALDNQKGLAEFNPSKFPNAQLYADLGNPQVSDGVERLVAAQRYYYDFFVRKEGLTFLTFDTMGWAASVTLEETANELGIGPNDPNYQLLKTSLSFEYFYPGDEYVDWVSITWYVAEHGGEEPIENHLERLAFFMDKLKEIAPDKPVFIMELGFGGKNQAEKVKAGLVEIMKYPNINGFAMWSKTSIDNFDFLIRPNTSGGKVFKKMIADNPEYFHSCVYFSDGTKIRTCK